MIGLFFFTVLVCLTFVMLIISITKAIRRPKNLASWFFIFAMVGFVGMFFLRQWVLGPIVLLICGIGYFVSEKK